MRVRSCCAPHRRKRLSRHALAPEFKVVDAASVLATGPAAFVPPAPVEKLATDQLTPDHATPRVVDVKTLLAAAPAPSDAVAASVPLAPGRLSYRRGSR